jgi:hypothetical protein
MTCLVEFPAANEDAGRSSRTVRKQSMTGRFQFAMNKSQIRQSPAEFCSYITLQAGGGLKAHQEPSGAFLENLLSD